VALARAVLPLENVGATASQIFNGAPTQAGLPAEFYCNQPKTVRRRG